MFLITLNLSRHVSISQPSGSTSASTAAIPVPPPSPVHYRSPIRRTVTQDEDDMVAQTTDSTVIIRMTPRHHGEEILSVEMAEEDDGLAGESKQEGQKEE